MTSTLRDTRATFTALALLLSTLAACTEATPERPAATPAAAAAAAPSAAKPARATGPGAAELTFINTPMARAIIQEEGGKIAREIGDDGATRGAQKNLRRGRVGVETQRDAFYAVAAGLTATGAERERLIESGIRAYEWGFRQAGPDGSFPEQSAQREGGGNFNALHNKAMFMHSAGRSLVLLNQAELSPALRSRVDALEAALVKSARWMADSQDLKDFRARAGNSNQHLSVAVLMQDASMLGNDPRLSALGRAMVQDILARQTPDGVLPEKGGFDAHYQSYSTELLARYADLLPRGEWRTTVETALGKGIKRWVSTIDADGQMDTASSTRTAACGPAIPGEGPKGKRADKLPLRLTYLEVMTGGAYDLTPVAERVESAGQTFRHRERCPAGSEPDDPV